MKKLTILVIFIFCLINIYGDDKPSWLKMRPISSEQYIGIGMALKSDPQFREKASLNALNNLASEIEVTISGEVVSQIMETNQNVEELLKSEIRTNTRAKLSDYELVATWQNKKEYWAYYRLEKEKYRINRQREIDKITSLALDLFIAAQENEKKLEFSLAISNYLQALQTMEPYLAEALTIDHNNQTIFLNNEIYLALQKLLSRIEIKAEKRAYTLKMGKTLQQNIFAHCTLQQVEETIPLKRLPLKCEFIKGEGELLPSTTSSERGLAKISLSKISSPQPIQVIQVKVDLDEFIKADSTSYLLQSMIDKLPLTFTRIVINIKYPLVYFDTVESNLGQRESLKYLEPALKSHLAKENFKFSDNLLTADYSIQLRAETKPGAEQFGMFTVFASVNLSITDLESGNMIFDTSLSRVKGIDLDAEKAGRKALENCSDKLFKQIIPVLKGE